MARRTSLYTLARRWNYVETLASRSPKRIVRRAKNKAVGRALARGGVWRRFWGGGR
jgi:hypothetical protein